MSNTSNDWTPVVENTFSFSELQCCANDFYLGPENWSKATPVMVEMQGRESPPRCNTNGRINGGHLLSSGLFIDNNLEGIIKMWTTGGRMYWLLNSSKKGGKTLEELKLKSCIERLDVKLIGNCSCAKSLAVAVDDVINAGLLMDWLLLKCEVTQMDFSNLDEEVAIYSTNSYNCLRNAVYNNSSLPLPLIHKCENESYQYFYLVFNNGGNPKITKLNNYLFKEKKKTNLKRGIKLMNSYTIKMEGYKFYGERGFDFFLVENETCIKKLIFRHIVWGLLQSWVRKIVKLYRFALTVEQVATQLLICHAARKDVEELKDTAARSRTLYWLGFCHHFFLYVKFFDLNSNQGSEYSISITNVETDSVSEIPIVQYFRQYLYVNRPSEANLLEAIAGTVHDDGNCSSHSSSIITHFLNNLYRTPLPRSVVYPNSFDENIRANFSCTENDARTVEVWSGNPIIATPNAFEEKPPINERFAPLIKARTVEEINSSVENVGALIDPNVTPQRCNTITKLLTEGEITAREVKYQLFPLVRDSLDACYLNNMVEMCQKDESTDEAFIKNCFGTAVASADKTKTFYIFLDQVFRWLQLQFTNSTCRRVMDLMIYEELKNKYSHVLNQNERASEAVAKQPKVKKLEGGYLGQCPQTPQETKPTSDASRQGNYVNSTGKNNENLHSKWDIQKENKNKPRSEEIEANEWMDLRAASKNFCSDLDVLHRECLYNKVSVALLRVQDMIDLPSYFKRKEVLNTARKKGAKRKCKKRKLERERVWVKKEAKVKGTIFRILKIGRRKSEYVKLEYETLEFLFKWKKRKKEEKKGIL